VTAGLEGNQVYITDEQRSSLTRGIPPTGIDEDIIGLLTALPVALQAVLEAKKDDQPI